MANGDISLPKIADSNWWKLRDLFKRKVPAVVTPNYLASALSMGEASARSNIFGPFKTIGLIDEDGKPTDLAYDWRDDEKYSSVCSTLLEKLYPQEVRDLFHSDDADINKLTTWFMNYARSGEPAAKMYAKFYLLLLKADLSAANAPSAKKESPQKNQNTTPKSKAAARPNQDKGSEKHIEAQNQQLDQSQPKKYVNTSPELHINIQLHISPESTADQIDKIFESMAKHLKDFHK